MLASIRDGLVDVAGAALASGLLVGSLEELVDEGTARSKEIGDGSGTTTYYRINADGPPD